MHRLRTVERQFPPRDDDVFPPRQRPAQRVPRLAAHHHGMPRREAVESAQILGYAPLQSVVIPDDAVFGNGYDNRNHGSLNF